MSDLEQARRRLTAATAKADGLRETIAAIKSRPESFDGFADVMSTGKMTRDAIIAHMLADQELPLRRAEREEAAARAAYDALGHG